MASTGTAGASMNTSGMTGASDAGTTSATAGNDSTTGDDSITGSETTGGGAMRECGDGQADFDELCLGEPLFTNRTCCLPTDIAPGDLDGNGTLDIATVIEYDNEVHLYLGSGSGVFNLGAAEPFGAPRPRDVALGHFDSDGLLDIAFPGNPNDAVGIVINDGGPSLTDAVTYDLNMDAEHITTGDLNGDGFDDIAIGGDDGYTLLLADGSGNGTFSAPADQPLTAAVLELVIADFNNNENLDLAFALVSGQVRVCLGNGSGSISSCNTVDVGTAPYGLAAGDFNGDLNIDIVTANQNDNTLSVLWGQGNGGFDTEVLTIPTGSAPVAVATGDLDHDGSDDIATVSSTDGTIYVYRTDGNGGFEDVIIEMSGLENESGTFTLHPESIALGDFNGDEALDIVVGTSDSTGNGERPALVLIPSQI